MAKIIGPGSLIVDVTGFAPRLPGAGETVKGTTLRFGPGGKGSNQMTAAHRAGAEAVIIGRRGDDFLGSLVARHYCDEGMRTDYITVTGEETGSALIEIDERDAQNRIVVILGANERVSGDDVLAAERDFADADAVLTQFETTLDAVAAAKALAQRYGKPFILNPAPYVPAPAALFDGVDYLTPNETEAEALTGVKVETIDDCRAAAERLFAMGVRNVIITLGVRGAYFSDGTREIVVPSVHVQAVETTGAGDAFNGGLATAIAEGMPIARALQFATCTAAISVTRLGSGPSMPRRSEIDALMAQAFGGE